MSQPEIVALIPARAGSVRIPGKNLKPLSGQPLIAYTIAAAQQSGCFRSVLVVTDSMDAGVLAQSMGASWVSRSIRTAVSDAPDILWVEEAMRPWAVPAFSILRCTSPFRTAATIQRAVQQFLTDEVHSLRAVRKAREHPGKQWFIENGCLKPWLDRDQAGTPWHSSPTQSLPQSYVQTGGLEIAWTYVLESFGTISGRKISPFLLEGPEALDINDDVDFVEVERIAAAHPELLSCLPAVPSR